MVELKPGTTRPRGFENVSREIVLARQSIPDMENESQVDVETAMLEYKARGVVGNVGHAEVLGGFICVLCAVRCSVTSL